jgi:hypothetical protein
MVSVVFSNCVVVPECVTVCTNKSAFSRVIGSLQTQTVLVNRVAGKTPKLPWSQRSCHITISHASIAADGSVHCATTRISRARIVAQANTFILKGCLCC